VKPDTSTELSSSTIRTVLFDLDGTLLDTAPDLCYALNILREENGLPPLSLEFVRPAASHGGIAIVRKGFDLEPEEPAFEPLKKRFLEIGRKRSFSLFIHGAKLIFPPIPAGETQTLCL